MIPIKFLGHTQVLNSIKSRKEIHISASKGPSANRYWISEISLFLSACTQSRSCVFPCIWPYADFLVFTLCLAVLISLQPQVLLPVSPGSQATTQCPSSFAQRIFTGELHDCYIPWFRPLPLLIDASITLVCISRPSNGLWIFWVLENVTFFWREMNLKVSFSVIL